MIALILIFVLVAFVFHSWLCLVRDHWSSNIKGPFPLPIVGNGHLLLGGSKELIPSFRRMAEKYGDAVLFFLISQRFVLLSHPKYIEEIMTSTEEITKGISYNFLHAWLGQGLLTASGHKWKSYRKFLTPAFHYVILQKYLPVFLKNNNILIDKLKQLADGTPVDVSHYMAMVALDNITEAIMGVSVNAQMDSESEYVKANEQASYVISTRMRNLLLTNDFIFNVSPQKIKQTKALEVLHRVTNKVIQARRRVLEESNITKLEDTAGGMKNKHAFLDLLLLGEIDGKKIDDESVREQVDTFMFEGHDTTSSGITFCLFCISNDKRVQQNIIDEQMRIFGDDIERESTFNDLQQMKYLELVIKETLRLYPSVPFIQRMVTHDKKIAGLDCSKGTTILINLHQLQRNADLFDRPLEFRPERFEKNLTNPFNWFAFSAGPRNCIGQKLAMVEMKVVLSRIIRHFELQSSGIEPILNANLILRSQNGVYIKLLPRVVSKCY
uniref:Cytochrome P450 CYP4L29 n=1 Tax=Zygaena filipendulae TaxID=287375 RepID=A0A286MXL9_9NEOP|nr:cytochrome P450 CYP4L29 [Zygaena filipendulae]